MAEIVSLTPALLSDVDAARYLLLLDGERTDPDAAVKALNRLVDKGLVRPCIVGRHRRYSVRELDRFIGEQTERYGA